MRRLEPIYIAQASLDEVDQRQWLYEQNQEAKVKGVTFARVSVCPKGTWPGLNLILYEGWSERPEDQGDIRWQLQAEKSP